MTATIERPAPGAASSGATFESLNPANGDVVGVHPICSKADVDAAVQRAREGADWWGALSFGERAEFLLAWRSVITRRIAQLAQLVHLETGKPTGDAQLEIVLAIDHIAWAAKHAKKVLGSRKVKSGLLMANQASTVEYQPLGVIGVIGPCNYPVFTPCGSIAYALAAGNAVVFKPSEYTPGVGRWLADKFTEVVGGRPVFQVVTGFGETGNALCTAAVNKLAFTGSGATGKKVMTACAENLTPVLIEAGGKDSLIVDEDADLTKAAEAALWGGMSNAGQTCIGTERVYVHEKVFDAFINEITSQAKDLHAGPDGKMARSRCRHSSASSRATSMMPLPGAPPSYSAARMQSASASYNRRSSPMYPRTPPRSPTKPSDPRWRSTRSRAWMKPSNSLTPRSTDSPGRCSPRRTVSTSPVGCVRE